MAAAPLHPLDLFSWLNGLVWSVGGEFTMLWVDSTPPIVNSQCVGLIEMGGVHASSF